MLVVTHEDRPQAWIGVQLLVLSLRRWCPDLRVRASLPGAGAGLRSWMQARAVDLVDDPALAHAGWNVKPRALLGALAAGASEAIWIDSDVILAGDFRHLLEAVGGDTLVVSDEHRWGVHHGGHLRTELWGLEPGRTLEGTASSGILRITAAHRPLLQAWKTLLECEVYADAQRREWHTRPVHMVGDQDVLTALLGSRRFAQVPVRYFKSGRDLILNVGPAGYTVSERLANAGRPLPPLIHCTGPKPWETGGCGLGAYYRRAFMEVSEYLRVAREYQGELRGASLPWHKRTALARVLTLLSGGREDYAALAFALFHGLARRAKRSVVGTWWSDPGRNLRSGDVPNGEALLAAAECNEVGANRMAAQTSGAR